MRLRAQFWVFVLCVFGLISPAPLAVSQTKPQVFGYFKTHKFELEDYDRRYKLYTCLLYTSPSPRDLSTSRMPSSA